MNPYTRLMARESIAVAKALMFFIGIVALAMVLAMALLGGCQKPLPVSPEMRCAFDPGCGATDYPAGAARDAGRE